MASRSPTKNLMIPKSQAIADGNFDCRNRHRIVKAGENEWWCWNFDQDKAEYAWPWNAILQFVHVRKVTRTIYNRQTFLQCDCGYYDRIGIPCGHIFWLVNCMSMEIFHIHHWKVYDAHYGDKTRFQSLMVQAQVCTRLHHPVLTLHVSLYIANYSYNIVPLKEEHFQHEGLGVLISHRLTHLDTSSLPNLVIFEGKSFYTSPNTTVFDIAEATYVLDKSDRSGCTMADLISFHEEKTPATNFSSPCCDFCGYGSHQGLLSPIATCLHTEVEESHESSQWSPNSQTNDDDIHFLGTDSKDEIRKTIISAMDQVLCSNRVPSYMIKNLRQRL